MFARLSAYIRPVRRVLAGSLGATGALLLTAALLMAATARAEPPTQVRLTTNMGDIVVELALEQAPKTTENFLKYVIDGFYDGTIFHRTIQDFIIQGGGFTTDYQRKETRQPVVNEAASGLRNLRGTIAMARTSHPHSATAQFFINLTDNDFLDHQAKSAKGWGYAVFGKVTEGMDVAERIVAIPTVARETFQNLPSTPVIIEKASLLSIE
ncbi:MAG: peptidyl-prolyl cis-trans isomerase [Gammaproteobacteria bacterium]|nr:peptidyl-prolyl cis-trans isomerase [Gammaproteobacteria bacterium]